jgi:MFS family permease
MPNRAHPHAGAPAPWSPAALGLVFCANGAGLGAWVPQIPVVQARLGLSEGALGLALLAMTAGALAAMPLAGAMIPRLGSRAALRLSSALFFAGLALPLLASSLPELVAALAVLGAGNGALDVSMNAQGVALERARGGAFMSRLHAMWSLGGLLGAGATGGALAAAVPSQWWLAGAGAVLGAAALGASLLLPSLDAAIPATGAQGVAQGVAQGARFARPRGVVAVLGLLAFLGLLAEGSVWDWSAVYLRTTVGTSDAHAAAGAAACSLTMCTGRFLGDWLTRRLGGVWIVRAGALLAAGGLALALVTLHPVVAVLGFGCVGAGIANIVPVLFRAAGAVSGVASAHALAAVTTLGYLGFLAGPPVIGAAAELASLRIALGLVVLATLAIAVGASSRSLAAASIGLPARQAGHSPRHAPGVPSVPSLAAPPHSPSTPPPPPSRRSDAASPQAPGLWAGT